MRAWKKLRLVQALSHRPVFLLWAGEALSAVGDEVYKVALTWIAVGLIGAGAGYLAAAQAGAILVVGLLGGYWADHWEPRHTMLYADLSRAVLVLLPVAWARLFPPSIGLLFFVAVGVSAVSAFFEPALMAVVPRLVKDRRLLQATNGLMGTTNRLARAVGPSLVGFLTGLVPIVHFFTLDAISFGCSAWAVMRLRRSLPEPLRSSGKRASLRDSMLFGFKLLRHDRLLRFVIGAKALTTGAWGLVIPLGVALLVGRRFPGDVRAYGLLLASYGVGNVSAALVLSNVTILRPMRTMGLGFMTLGLGFAGVALLPALSWKMASMAIAAVGGPMNDLAHIDVIQSRFSPERIAPVMRFRMAIEFGGMFLCLLLAPLLFDRLGPEFLIVLAGFVNFAVGFSGLLAFGE